MHAGSVCLSGVLAGETMPSDRCFSKRNTMHFGKFFNAEKHIVL